LTALLAMALAAAGIGAETAAAQTQPSVVLIITDDQRWDTLSVMPTVQSELVSRGVTFTNAFVTNALCCPSRATFLTGKYSHGTGIYLNRRPHGGAANFKASSTVATWLNRRGYSTALVGKYLNNYVGPARPPGWDRWVAFSGAPNYYHYRLSVDGTTVAHGGQELDYSTDVLAAEADSFIRTATGPLFLHFSPFAPHFRRADALDVTPAVRHAGTFAGLPGWRPPNYNEPDVSDKPAWLRLRTPSLTPEIQAKGDTFRQRQLEALLAADDAVATIIDALNDTGRLSNTLVIYASDNGNDWGEHRRFSKLVPYETSIRIPLVVRYDALVAAPRTDDRLAVNIDVAPTIADAADVIAPGADGRSLLPALANPGLGWRNDFLLEHLGVADGIVPTYCGVRNRTQTYIQYGTGEEEIYDLAADPFQLENQARNPAFRRPLASFRQRTRALCNPPPPRFRPRDPCLIRGSSRANRLRGTMFFDSICGYGNADRIEARAGGDVVSGGHGNDLLRGEGGHDRIYPGLGLDRVYGGIGRDVIYAADSRRDVIRCGEGLDTVYVNPGDVVSGCERIRRR
jgi:N-acetylglucosamine-6-sulfatase